LVAVLRPDGGGAGGGLTIDVQRRVDTARVYMPTDLDPPVVEKNGADQSVLTYALSSKSMSGPALADLVTDRVLPEVKAIPNVSGADVYGEPGREIQVRPDPLKLMAVGATLPDIFNALAINNANLPGGRIDEARAEEAAREATRSLEPPSDIHGASHFRKTIASQLIREAIVQAQRRAERRV